MTKIEKKLQKWKNSKQEVRKEEIEPVLNKYFPNMWTYGSSRGSHIYKVSHPKLIGFLDYGPNGEFTIPTTGGQRIKHWYLKKLLKAIEIITEGNDL
ncbi:MAG: hypothetical protein N3A67_09210 [Ignavibacteria bacterium]|nr:hypothetical protein [Ignavibacteria bacterium]